MLTIWVALFAFPLAGIGIAQSAAFPIQQDHNDAQHCGQILRLEPSYRGAHLPLDVAGGVTIEHFVQTLRTRFLNKY